MTKRLKPNHEFSSTEVTKTSLFLFFALLVMLMMPAGVRAEGLTDNLKYRARLGYNIGGTSPVGLPATIRGLNRYTLQPNFCIGFDVIKPIKPQWSANVGIRLENKAMNEDARVKNYYEEMVRGGEVIAGRFTGDVTTQVTQFMITVPIQAQWNVSSKFDLRFGPYASILLHKSFKGHAHNGYLRVGDPTGPKVIIGDDPATWGSYDFSDEMRMLQWGVNIAADYDIYRRIGVFAEINWGLSGVHDSSFKTIEQTLYPIFGTFGLTYKIK